MVSFGVYAALSTLALATTVGYAKHTREQFYSTVIFLVDTKICVCVLCNFTHDRAWIRGIEIIVDS